MTWERFLFVIVALYPEGLSLHADPDVLDASPEGGSSAWGPHAMSYSINNPLLSYNCTCGGACNCHCTGKGPFLAYLTLSDA